MADSIDIGDVVELKSGGPGMTVERRLHSRKRNIEVVECCWFNSASDGAVILQRDSFPETSLKKKPT